MGLGLLLPEYENLGPELQCLLKVKEDLLSLVLIFQDAKNNVLNWLKSKLFHFLLNTMISLTTSTASIQAIYLAC